MKLAIVLAALTLAACGGGSDAPLTPIEEATQQVYMGCATHGGVVGAIESDTWEDSGGNVVGRIQRAFCADGKMVQVVVKQPGAPA